MTKAPIILALAAVLAASGAAADPQMMRHVRYTDLNLQNPDGVAALERRIARAAAGICTTNMAVNSPALDLERQQCVDDTLASTRASVDQAVRAQRAAKLVTAANQ